MKDRLDAFKLPLDPPRDSPSASAFRFIYLLECKNFYKIGFARDIRHRMHGYRVNNPFDVRVVYHKWTRDYKEFEEWIFNNFSERHHKGEWFDFSPNDILKIERHWFAEREGEYKSCETRVRYPSKDWDERNF